MLPCRAPARARSIATAARALLKALDHALDLWSTWVRLWPDCEDLVGVTADPRPATGARRTRYRVERQRVVCSATPQVRQYADALTAPGELVNHRRRLFHVGGRTADLGLERRPAPIGRASPTPGPAWPRPRRSAPCPDLVLRPSTASSVVACATRPVLGALALESPLLACWPSTEAIWFAASARADEPWSATSQIVWRILFAETVERLGGTTGDLIRCCL